jgi:hypothetical protein
MTVCVSPYIGFFHVLIKDVFPIESCWKAAIPGRLLMAKGTISNQMCRLLMAKATETKEIF